MKYLSLFVVLFISSTASAFSFPESGMTKNSISTSVEIGQNFDTDVLITGSTTLYTFTSTTPILAVVVDGEGGLGEKRYAIGAGLCVHDQFLCASFNKVSRDFVNDGRRTTFGMPKVGLNIEYAGSFIAHANYAWVVDAYDDVTGHRMEAGFEIPWPHTQASTSIMIFAEEFKTLSNNNDNDNGGLKINAINLRW